MYALTYNDMKLISERLLGAAGRAILDKSAMLRPMIPSLELSQQAISAALMSDPHAQARAELRDSKRVNDRTFDRISKGIYYVMFGMSLLRLGTPQGDELERALDMMFPYDLKITRVSYPEQVSFVNRLKQSITASVVELLGKIKLPDGGTLDEARLAWFAAAEALEKDLDEEAKLGAKPKTLTRDESLAARRDWLRTMNALLAVIAVADITEEERKTLYNLATRVTG
jgi:hypothetical protein